MLWNWFEYIQEYVTTGNRVELLAALTKAPFLKDLSLDTIATAAEGIPVRDVDGWKLLKSMPWSRRKRRTLYQSEDWNVHSVLRAIEVWIKRLDYLEAVSDGGFGCECRS